MLKRCIIYARYSSENQRAESIDSQLRLCREHAAKRGYVVVAVYSDYARSGTSDQRDEFQRMIEDIMSGRVECDIMLAWKFDRLWRDKDAPGYYKFTLRQRGVYVESVALQLDRTNPYSVIMEALDHGQAAAFSVNLAIEITRGLTQNATMAKTTGGRPALGYRVTPDGVFEIEPRGADAVRLVFSMYAGGHTLGQIIDACNERGYRTGGGRPFGKNSLHDLLHNQKYAGVYEFRSWRADNTKKRKTGHMYEASEEIIRVAGGVPAIVDGPTWDAAQARLARNKEKRMGKSNAGRHLYLLSGVAYCGLCGSALNGLPRSMTYKGETKRYYYYACPKARAKSCALTPIRDTELEAMCLHLLDEHLFSEESQAAMRNCLREWEEAAAGETIDRAEDLRKQLHEVETQLARMVNAIANGIMPGGSVSERINALEKERAAVHGQIAAQQAEGAVPRVTIDVGAVLAALRDQLRADTDQRQRHALIIRIAQAVVVYPDHIEVMLPLDPQTGKPDQGSIKKLWGSDWCRWTEPNHSPIIRGKSLVLSCARVTGRRGGRRCLCPAPSLS